jgi:hypothetical protein
MEGPCVIPPGFEPGTHSLEGCCSIQLSYGTILVLEIDRKVTTILIFFQHILCLTFCFYPKSHKI